MKGLARQVVAISVAAVFGPACTGTESDVCYVSTPEEYAEISEVCQTVFVTSWPTDELELTSSVPERSLHIGPLEGVEESVPFDLRRIVVSGFGAVHGAATEEAILRDVVLPQILAPVKTIEPRVFEEPCQAWDTEPDSPGGMSLGPVPGGRTSIVSDVELKCFNLVMNGSRDDGVDPWGTFTLSINENAKPVGFVRLHASEEIRLEHLTQLGSRAHRIELFDIDQGLASEFRSWLLSQESATTLFRCAAVAGGANCEEVLP